MKKVFTIVLVLGLGLFLFGPSAQAVTLGFNPASQDAPQGTSVLVDLVISGLEGTALGAFDLTVAFDPTILDCQGVAFGDPSLGDQLNLTGAGSIAGVDGATPPGSITFWEVSFDSPNDLNTLQADSFVLAVLVFHTLEAGTSQLSLSDIILGDADGASLAFTADNGSITVNESVPVPLPSALLLLASALGGLPTIRRKLLGRI